MTEGGGEKDICLWRKIAEIRIFHQTDHVDAVVWVVRRHEEWISYLAVS